MTSVCTSSILKLLSVVLSLQAPVDNTAYLCYGGFYTVKYTHTFISCVNFCWFSRRCKAVNWVRKSRECRLHDSALTDPSPTTTDPRCISTEVHTSHMGPSHPCSGRPCPDTHVCAPSEAASSHVCLPLEGCLYTGCYLDDWNRMINDLHEENDSMTREWCLTRCRQGNFLLAGLEFYKHCFCGNSYDNVKYTIMSEADCNTPCMGNSGQMCGGPFRLSIFQCT